MSAQSEEPIQASIIVSLYNKAPYIKQTLQSALSMQGAATEIVVVEDGSTDGSDLIARELAAQHGEIRLLENPSKGAVSAMNYGIEQARAPYVFVLDGDDICLPWRVQVCVALLDSFPQLNMIAARGVRTPPGGVAAAEQRCAKLMADCGGIKASRLTAGTYCRDNRLAHSSAVFRKAAVDQVGGYSASNMCYDYELYIRLLATGEQWMLNIPLSIAVDDRTSIFKSEKYDIYMKDYRACQNLARKSGPVSAFDYASGTLRYLKRNTMRPA